MIAFLCRTPIHLFRTIQLKFEMFASDKVDVFVFSSFADSEEVFHRLEKTGIFSQVYYIRDEDYIKGEHLVDIKACLGRSHFKSILLTQKYEQLFSYNIYGVFNELAYNVSKRNNPELIYNIIEDAPTIYGIEEYENKGVKKIFPLLGLDSSVKNIDYWWFSCPEKMSVFGKGVKKKLPAVDRKKVEMVNCINNVFAYKEETDLTYADIIIMEECYTNDGLLNGEDKELFDKLFANSNYSLVVKLHPRTKINRFDRDYSVISSIGIPWEVYVLNQSMKNKILVSLSCATMTSSKLLFGDELRSMVLYPILEDKVLERNTKNRYFTTERKEKINSQKELYSDTGKFAVAYSIEEATGILAQWEKEISYEH